MLILFLASTSLVIGTSTSLVLAVVVVVVVERTVHRYYLEVVTSNILILILV